MALMLSTARAEQSLRVDRNASEAIPRLWQGALVPPGRISGVDVLVLCAMEHQPHSAQLPGVRVMVVHAPLDDAKPTLEEIITARQAAVHVARELRRGRRVLVTCAQGRNRSGLVTALALRYLGVTADEAIRLIRRARGANALSNPHFVDVIKKS